MIVCYAAIRTSFELDYISIISIETGHPYIMVRATVIHGGVS